MSCRRMVSTTSRYRMQTSPARRISSGLHPLPLTIVCLPPPIGHSHTTRPCTLPRPVIHPWLSLGRLGQAKAGPVKPSQARLFSALLCPMHSSRMQSSPIHSNPIHSNPIQPNSIHPNPVHPNPIQPKPNPTHSLGKHGVIEFVQLNSQHEPQAIWYRPLLSQPHPWLSHGHS